MGKNNAPKENGSLVEEELIIEKPAYSVFHNLSGSLLTLSINGEDKLIRSNEKFSVLTSHEDQIPTVAGLIKVSE